MLRSHSPLPDLLLKCRHFGRCRQEGVHLRRHQEFLISYQVNNLKKFKVTFSGEVDPDIQWDFEPVERELIVSAGETAIVFYRLYNREPKPIVGFSVYNIYPEECNAYFSKIQCFCFNQQLINPNEELLLPIFFYIEP